MYKKPGEAQAYMSGVHETPENLINTYQVVVYVYQLDVYDTLGYIRYALEDHEHHSNVYEMPGE